MNASKMITNQAQQVWDDGDIENAKSLYFQALKINPREASALIDLACLFSRLKNDQKAYAYAMQSTWVDPFNAIAWFNLGCCTYNLGDKEKANQHFNKCLEIDPSHEDARQYLEE